MSAEAVGWVYRYSPYEGATFAVHLAMADVANDVHDYELWTFNAYLATKARVSIASVERAHATMRAEGFLDLLQPARGRGEANRWRFLFPDVPVVWETRHSEGLTRKAPHRVAKAPHGEGVNSIEPNQHSPNGECPHEPIALPLLDKETDQTEGTRTGQAGQTVQELVGTYVEDYQHVCNNKPPSKEWRAIAGREARKALANGETPDHVAACLYVIAQERKSPATLPHVIADSHAGAPRRPR